MLEELKEIEEIINKLDNVNIENWNKRENETEEEFEKRIKNIEEDIEEELIDVISDILLNKQKINEEEVVKEAAEKIENEYKIYKEAFETDINGKLVLKNNEELTKLGYESDDEIKKLTTIVNNYNDPDSYIESIRNSIKSKKNLDEEIERKMEIAKAYISTKLKGEEFETPLNKPKTKKYEDNNNYIRTTKYLNRVPVIQNEFINNNRLIVQSYTQSEPKSNIPQTQKNIATGANQIKIVTNPVKIQVLKNLENKMDSSNNLSKQKIKSRIQLKRIFKEYENKELSDKEFNELSEKIQKVMKTYPDTVNNEVIKNLFDTFNVKTSSQKSIKEKQIESKKRDIEEKAKKIQKELDKKIGKDGSIIDTESMITAVTPVIKDTAKKIVTGAKEIGEAIGKFAQQGGEKVENFIKKQARDKEIKLMEEELAELDRELEEEEERLKNINKGLEENEQEVKETEIVEQLETKEQQVNKKTYYSLEDYNKLMNDFDKRFDEIFNDSDNNDGWINIKLLEKLCKCLQYGVKNKDGSLALEKNPEKVKEYRGKMLRYIVYLKKEAETKYDNPIKNIKNEAKFGIIINNVSQEIISRKNNNIENQNSENLNDSNHKKRISLLFQTIDGIELMIKAENLKRINNSKNREKLQELINNYEEKLKNGGKIGEYALEILGDIYFTGIKCKNGRQVLNPDIIKARAVYEKMIKDYKGIDNEITYNRLLTLYSDNRLPIYDEMKAKEIENVMKQNGINISNNEKENEVKNVKDGFTYVCSDLHGEYEAYQTIMDRIKDKDKLYILGDVIDKGPDGIRILQDIEKRQEKGQVEFLLGNHEYMLLKTLLGEEKQEDLWTYNESSTREAYEKLTQVEQEKMKNFLYNSLVYKQIAEGNQEYYLVHARAIQGTNSKSGTYKELSQGEYKPKIFGAVFDRVFYNCSSEEIAKEGVFTIIGHTPTMNKIELKKNYVNIDCGISYGKNVSLLNLTTGDVEYFSSEEVKEINKEKLKEENQEEK